jgi:hypothetical protein
MTEHRYPLSRILADYLLGGTGTLASAAMIALAPSTGYVVVIFGALTAVFLLFTIRTASRHGLRITADAEGLGIRGTSVRRLEWGQLEGLTLRYYATRRNRKDGWMTLCLTGAGQKMAIDSHLEGFEAIARSAADAALGRRLVLDPTTRINLAALDIPVPEPLAAPVSPSTTQPTFPRAP